MGHIHHGLHVQFSFQGVLIAGYAFSLTGRVSPPQWTSLLIRTAAETHMLHYTAHCIYLSHCDILLLLRECRVEGPVDGWSWLPFELSIILCSMRYTSSETGIPSYHLKPSTRATQQDHLKPNQTQETKHNSFEVSVFKFKMFYGQILKEDTLPSRFAHPYLTYEERK